MTAFESRYRPWQEARLQAILEHSRPFAQHSSESWVELFLDRAKVKWTRTKVADSSSDYYNRPVRDAMDIEPGQRRMWFVEATK